MYVFRHEGYWRGNGSIELVNVRGRVYALNVWDGRRYSYCWECLRDDYGEFFAGSDDLVIRPVYRYEREKIDISAIAPDTPQWMRANETVDFEISKM